MNPFAENPYQSPSPIAHYMPSPSSYDAAAMRARAIERVRWPGVMLHLSGAVCLIVALGCFGFAAAAWQDVDTDPAARFVAVLFGAIGAVALLISPLMFIGGYRLPRLQSYALVLTATIVTMIFGFLTCLPLMLLGIWPLIVLLDSNVRLAFAEHQNIPA